MNLEDLKTFCVIGESLSYSRASEVLGMQKPMLSKLVKKLEAELGVKLFERSTRRVRITDAGKALLNRGRVLVEESQKMVDEIKGLKQEVRGELKIGAPTDLGILLCKEVLPHFSKKYPEIKIALSLSYDYSDLFAEEIDIALRVGFKGDSQLIATKVGESKRGLFASSAYLKKNGIPANPDDLKKHSMLGFKSFHREEVSWTLTKGNKKVEVFFDGKLCVENFQALSEAAIAGLGIVLLPEMFFQKPIREGKLIRVLPEWELPIGEIMAVYPSRDLKPAKLTAFLEVLKTELLYI